MYEDLTLVSHQPDGRESVRRPRKVRSRATATAMPSTLDEEA